MPIIRNAFKCKKCGRTVDSLYRHHFNRCVCWNFTDGGFNYIRCEGNREDFIDLSEFDNNDTPTKK